MAVQKRDVTVAEFENFIALSENRERRLELVNGEIVEKVVTQEHGIIAGNSVTEINFYLRQRAIGRAAVEVRHRATDDQENDLLPDMSFAADLNKTVIREGTVSSMPDLAVEIKAPNDSFKKMRAKARYYLAHGSRLVWLIFPDQRVIEVYTDDDEYVVGEDEMLNGGNVLPDFSIPVRNLFKNL